MVKRIHFSDYLGGKVREAGRRFKIHSPVLRKLFNGEPEFRIVEKIKDGLRSRVISDVDGREKELMVSRDGP